MSSDELGAWTLAAKFGLYFLAMYFLIGAGFECFRRASVVARLPGVGCLVCVRCAVNAAPCAFTTTQSNLLCIRPLAALEQCCMLRTSAQFRTSCAALPCAALPCPALPCPALPCPARCDCCLVARPLPNTHRTSPLPPPPPQVLHQRRRFPLGRPGDRRPGCLDSMQWLPSSCTCCGVHYNAVPCRAVPWCGPCPCCYGAGHRRRVLRRRRAEPGGPC